MYRKNVCEECGSEYYTYSDNSRFCTRNCYYKHVEKTKKRTDKKCPICGKMFYPKRDYSVFCSVECRTESSRRRIRCICDFCGKSFDRIVSEYAKRKTHYCSEECRRSATKWTDEEDEIIIESYKKVPTSEIVAMLDNRWDKYAIRRRAQSIGITSTRCWTDSEISILREHYERVPLSELIEMLPNRTTNAIRGMAHNMGLLSYFYLKHTYSDEEDKYIIENYLKEDACTIAKRLGRTRSGVVQHIFCLGLSVPSEPTVYPSLASYIRGKNASWMEHKKAEKKYTCEITWETDNVVLHHILGFNIILAEAVNNLGLCTSCEIDAYTDKDLENVYDEFMLIQESNDLVICISSKLHKAFHGEYGYGNNTPEQWNQFLDKIKLSSNT